MINYVATACSQAARTDDHATSRASMRHADEVDMPSDNRRRPPAMNRHRLRLSACQSRAKTPDPARSGAAIAQSAGGSSSGGSLLRQPRVDRRSCTGRNLLLAAFYLMHARAGRWLCSSP